MIKKIINAYRSAYFCFRYLPFKQAIYVPIHVLSAIEYDIKGKVVLDYDYKTKKIYINGSGSPAVQHFPKGRLMIAAGGTLILRGSGVIGNGMSIRIDENGTIILGADFFINNNCLLRSDRIIEIGDHCVMGWNVTINTTDGHQLFVDDQPRETSGDIRIGHHVWISQGVAIGKNCSIANETVIAQCSVVSKSLQKEHCLYGGIPARLIKENVSWKK